jgi:hypothetical protein
MYQVPKDLYSVSGLSFNDQLVFDFELMVPISQNTTMMFRSSTTLAGNGISFRFGGKKVSPDAPPNYWSELALSILT